MSFESSNRKTLEVEGTGKKRASALEKLYRSYIILVDVTALYRQDLNALKGS